MRIANLMLLGLVLVSPAAAQGGAGAAPTKSATLEVLFIGNSYTYFNDLPWMLEELGRRAKPPVSFATRSVVAGGATLEGHWKAGKATEVIRSRPWSFVVMQEQSLRPLRDAELMTSYIQKFSSEIVKRKAKAVLYMTWARENRPEMQKDLAAAYGAAARKIGAQVAPVGLAWQASLARRPELRLHTGDKSHPNPTGTYLTACTLYATLTGRDPQGLPGSLVRDGKTVIALPKRDASHLQAMAREVGVRKK